MTGNPAPCKQFLVINGQPKHPTGEGMEGTGDGLEVEIPRLTLAKRGDRIELPNQG